MMIRSNNLEENQIPDRRLLETKILLRPDEAARILRISQRQVYYLCQSDKLKSVRIRRSLRVKTESVKALLLADIFDEFPHLAQPLQQEDF